MEGNESKVDKRLTLLVTMEKLTRCILVIFVLTISQGGAATTRKIIQTDDAPGTTLPLSQAVQVDNIVYVSGTLGRHPNGQMAVGITNQTTQALENIGRILKAADSSFCSVVKVTVLLADMEYYGAMNEVYAKYFITKYPARMAYAVAEIPAKGLVEIDVIAISGKILEA